MTTEKEQLEAEIAKRDARIAELEASEAVADDMFRSLGGEIYKLNAKLSALKAQQPSAGVVLPDLIAELKKQADEIAREGHAGWGNTMLSAAEALSVAGVEDERAALENLAKDYERRAEGPCPGWVWSADVARDIRSRLNPCRAQASGDSE